MSISVNHREFYLRPPAGTSFHIRVDPNNPSGIIVTWDYQDSRGKGIRSIPIPGRPLTQGMPTGRQIRATQGCAPVYSPMDLILHFEKGNERDVLAWLREWAFELGRLHCEANPTVPPIPGIEDEPDTGWEYIEALQDIIETNLLSQVEYWESQDPVAPLSFEQGGESVTNPSTPNAKAALAAENKE